MKTVLACAVALCAGSTIASAAVQSVSGNFLIPLGAGQATLTLAGFDTTLGTLQSVRVSVDAKVSIDVRGENRNALASNTFAGSYFGSVTVSGIPEVPLVASMNAPLLAQTVAPFGSEASFVYAPGVQWATNSNSATIPAGPEAPGIGSPVELLIRGTGGWNVTTTSNSQINIQSFQADGTVTIEYTYAPIPAPAAAGLLGVAGVVAARRRR